MLEVLYDGVVIFIPRFDHRKVGNPKTFVNLATSVNNATVRVCKYAGDCYKEISLNKDVKNLYERNPDIENFLSDYSGALRLEFINLTDPSQLVCYTGFIRADGTVVRVPCFMGSGVEVGARSQ